MKKKVFEKYGEAVIANQLDIKLFEALGYHLPLSDEDEPDVITHPECSGQIIEATPVSIDWMIRELQKMKIDGYNYVAIEHNEDKHGYSLQSLSLKTLDDVRDEKLSILND